MAKAHADARSEALLRALRRPLGDGASVDLGFAQDLLERYSQAAAPQAAALAVAALAFHLDKLRHCLRAVAASAARALDAGPRPVREAPDEAWLND